MGLHVGWGSLRCYSKLSVAVMGPLCKRECGAKLGREHMPANLEYPSLDSGFGAGMTV